MRARRLLPLLFSLCAVALVATGCFESKVSDTTISGEITIGQGSSAQTVNPAQGEGTVTGGEGSTGAASTGEDSGGSTQESTGGGAGADVAAGKAAFTATCGGCHALKDAGTTGNVGPDLDSLAPLTAERVAAQIEHGGGAMPPKLLTGADAANVAAYVASVAGK
jgi:sulfite dehydrogenase